LFLRETFGLRSRIGAKYNTGEDVKSRIEKLAKLLFSSLKNMRNFILPSALILFVSPFLFAGCANENSPPQENAESDSQNSIQISAPEIDAAEPAIAAASNGGVVVVWVEHGAGKTADVFLQKIDAEGEPSGEKTRVNRNAGEATAWRGDPPTVKVGADGAIYVGWTKRVKTETASGTDYYVSISRDGGKTFQTTAKVNDDTTPASHGMHSLAIDKNGKIYAAWLDERNIKKPAHVQNKLSPDFAFVKANYTPTPEPKQADDEAEPNSEVFFAVSSDGGKSFSPNKKLAHEVCPCCKTAVLAAPDGKIFVSWRQVVGDNFRHIAVASSADGGENFTAPTIVSDDRWQIAGCPVSGASLVSGKDNNVRLAWFSAGAAGATGIYQTYSTDGGKTFAPRALVSEGFSPISPQFVVGESNVSHIAWTNGEKQVFFAETATPETVGKAVPHVGSASYFAAANSKGKLFAVYVKADAKSSVRLAQIKQ
jgi:hypothetical protein